MRLATFPFMIYSPSRTGSTTLVRLLNCHPAIRCVWEPFNPTHRAIFAIHSQEILRSHGGGGLEAALKYLATTCNGFKHVWHPGGWPFEDPQLNDRMLLLGDAKVIMLRRRNALQRAISERISQQMGIWTIYSEDDRRHIRQHQFAPLDVEQLRQDIAVVQAEEKRLYELIGASGKAWRAVSYEEIFSPGASMEAGMAAVKSLWEFLGVEALADPARLEMVRQLLDPAMTGFGNAAAYERVPNIQEVEKALGHDETGHVLGPMDTRTRT